MHEDGGVRLAGGPMQPAPEADIVSRHHEAACSSLTNGDKQADEHEYEDLPPRYQSNF